MAASSPNAIIPGISASSASIISTAITRRADSLSRFACVLPYRKRTLSMTAISFSRLNSRPPIFISIARASELYKKNFTRGRAKWRLIARGKQIFKNIFIHFSPGVRLSYNKSVKKCKKECTFVRARAKSQLPSFEPTSQPIQNSSKSEYSLRSARGTSLAQW